MCRKSRMLSGSSPSRARQSGLSIISAIFMLVLLAALAAFMLTFSSVQHVTQAQDIQGSRAYWAAKAGIEWGAGQVGTNNACASTMLTVEGFSVLVTCAPSGPYLEGTGTVSIYLIASNAKQGTVGGVGYVERELQATVGK